MKHLLLSTLLLVTGPALAQQATKSTTHHSHASYVAIFAALVAIFAALSAARKKRAQQQK